MTFVYENFTRISLYIDSVRVGYIQAINETEMDEIIETLSLTEAS